MKKSLPLAAVIFAATLVLGSLGLAQDPSKKETAPAPLKSVSCPPECGFMCRSHDEKELIEIVKSHALNSHGKVLTDEQVKSFMQTERPSMAASAKRP
jgi:predicted small metal-binding protein